MFQVIRVLVALGIVAGCSGPVAAQTPGGPIIPPARAFNLQAGDVPNWQVGRATVTRRENNVRARQDSRPPSLHFYRGSWAALGRTGGWYERMILYQGPIDAVATILISEFPDARTAARAYARMVPAIPIRRLPIGARAAEWQPAAQRNRGDPFATFVVYLQDGPVVAEISSNVTAPRKMRLADPGPAIARKLVAIGREASIPVVSSTTVVDGLRLSLSIPDLVYPRNALAQVTIEVSNQSQSPVSLLAQPSGALTNAIQIRELNAAGQVVPAPPPFEDFSLPPPPSPPIPLTLQPKQTLTLRPTIILWAGRLQVETRCFSGNACGDAILGTPIAVRLAGAETPSIDLLDSGGQPLALVHVSEGYHGRLLYRSSIQCRFTGPVPPNQAPTVPNEIPGYAVLDNAWAETPSILLSPLPCPQDYGPATLAAWRLIAGWPDHSIGVLDYHAP